MTSSPISLDTLITFVKVQRPAARRWTTSPTRSRCRPSSVTQADSLIGHFVDQARRSGASWSQIGASMGVSKQAAQQRFVPRGPVKMETGFGDFSRFTQRARDVLAAAEDLARAADVTGIGSAHLAAALMTQPEGLAARAMTDLGVTDAGLRSALGLPEAAAAAEGESSAERVPLGPSAVATLKAALRQALHLGHNYIGTEHILLGLVDEQDGTTATLAGLGVTQPAAQQQITAAFAALRASRAQSGSGA